MSVCPDFSYLDSVRCPDFRKKVVRCLSFRTFTVLVRRSLGKSQYGCFNWHFITFEIFENFEFERIIKNF